MQCVAPAETPYSACPGCVAAVDTLLFPIQILSQESKRVLTQQITVHNDMPVARDAVGMHVSCGIGCRM